MQLPDAAQEPLQNIFIANDRADLQVPIQRSLQAQQRGTLSRREAADAFRQIFPKPREGLDSGNVFAERQ
jgi:hypothetical protein